MLYVISNYVMWYVQLSDTFAFLFHWFTITHRSSGYTSFPHFGVQSFLFFSIQKLSRCVCIVGTKHLAFMMLHWATRKYALAVRFAGLAEYDFLLKKKLRKFGVFACHFDISIYNILKYLPVSSIFSNGGIRKWIDTASLPSHFSPGIFWSFR